MTGWKIPISNRKYILTFMVDVPFVMLVFGGVLSRKTGSEKPLKIGNDIFQENPISGVVAVSFSEGNSGKYFLQKLTKCCCRGSGLRMRRKY